MDEREDRKGRIAKMMGDAKPNKRRGISVSGNNNIVVVGGNFTVGRAARCTPTRKQQRVWREEASSAIRERAFELKLTEDQVTAFAQSILKKFVPSLEALSAAELGRVFDSMHNMKRPALD